MEAGTRSLCEKFEVMGQARMGLSLLEMEVGMVEEERKLGGLSIEEEEVVEGEDCEMEEEEEEVVEGEDCEMEM